jgi:hypothetical protein
MFSKFCKFTSNVLKMVIYKNTVIPYFNILFKIMNTISRKVKVNSPFFLQIALLH